MKVESSLITTAKDLLNKINTKIDNFKKELCFDPNKKILKVGSLNDYVINLDEPIGKFAYINECIKNNLIPEYWIIDNPFLSIHANSLFLNSIDDSSRLITFNNDTSKIEIKETNLYKKSNKQLISLEVFNKEHGGMKYKKYLRNMTFRDQRNSLRSLNLNVEHTHGLKMSLKNKSFVQVDPVLEYLANTKGRFSELWNTKIREIEDKSILSLI
jgi:hypothetical protein